MCLSYSAGNDDERVERIFAQDMSIGGRRLWPFSGLDTPGAGAVGGAGARCPLCPAASNKGPDASPRGPRTMVLRKIIEESQQLPVVLCQESPAACRSEDTGLLLGGTPKDSAGLHQALGHCTKLSKTYKTRS